MRTPALLLAFVLIGCGSPSSSSSDTGGSTSGGDGGGGSQNTGGSQSTGGQATGGSQNTGGQSTGGQGGTTGGQGGNTGGQGGNTGGQGGGTGGQVVEIPTTPFGSHLVPYIAGSVLPNSASQAELDQAAAGAYDDWKSKYLKAGCGAGRYYVETKTQAGNLTVSEGHGYGMVLSAIMAGHDPDAQAHFDGLYQFFRDHPSANSPDLMSWYQDTSCNDAQGNDSASDGDIDIAFGLLLADKQWGSCGDIDYKAEALKVIAAIAQHELDGTGAYVLLGDWVNPGSGKYYTATRSSDFVTDHFRSFGAAAGGGIWPGLVDSTYTTITALRNGYSPGKGLLPDFVKNPGAGAAPVAANFLEGANDGAYDYNACRDPWRIGTDYLVSGDSRAKAEVTALTAWIEGATGGDPTNIRAGYQLNGTPSAGSDYLTMAFVAPFGVAAMADGAHMPWLNDLWSTIASAGSDGYYEDTIRLLTMIVMSGNWWAPEARPPVCSP